jgi:4'-phosphopantetheinyl transferase
LRDYYRSLLTQAELARLARYAFDHLKVEYLITRALCRTVLSAYREVPPQDWSFVANEYGRPEISTPGIEGLRFNLSNARSLVACVVTRTADAGVDVEEIERRGDPVAIADRYFSAQELQALNALPPERRRHRFFELWTLKESYIKARGMGLSIPLDQFSLLVDERPIRIAFDPRLGDRAEDWQFELASLSEQHLLAVGIRRGAHPDFKISLREVVPNARLIWKEAP